MFNTGEKSSLKCGTSYARLQNGLIISKNRNKSGLNVKKIKSGMKINHLASNLHWSLTLHANILNSG